MQHHALQVVRVSQHAADRFKERLGVSDPVQMERDARWALLVGKTATDPQFASYFHKRVGDAVFVFARRPDGVVLVTVKPGKPKAKPSRPPRYRECHG